MTKREQDHARLALVRRLPCCVCGMMGVDPHHITYAGGGGMGWKVDDKWTVPLCRRHHNELHQTGEANFWDRYRRDPMDIAQEITDGKRRPLWK